METAPTLEMLAVSVPGAALSSSVFGQPLLVQASAVLAGGLLVLHSLLTGRVLVPAWLSVAVVCVLGGRSSGLGLLLLIPVALGWLLSLREPVVTPSRSRAARTSPGHSSLLLPGLALCLVVHAIASTLLTDASWLPAANLGALVVLGSLVNAVARRGEPLDLARQIELMGCATAVVYLFFVGTRLSQAGVGTWTKVYAESSWLNSNSLGALFLLCASVPMARVARGEASVTTLATAVATAAACLATFSRSSLLGLAVLVLVMAIRRMRLIVPLGILTTALVLRPPSALADRIAYTFQGGQLDVSSSTRIELWRNALDVGLSHPLLGVGLPNLADHLGAYAETSGIQYAHNSYLTVLAAFGVPLFAVATILLLRLLHRLMTQQSSRNDALSLAAFAAAVGLAVASFFGEPLFAPPVVCVAVALVSSAMHEKVAT